MIIKSGDYVESLHGNVGVVKTVGKTVPVDGWKRIRFVAALPSNWHVSQPVPERENDKAENGKAENGKAENGKAENRTD